MPTAPGSTDPLPSCNGWARRVWALPLRYHVLALSVVLVGAELAAAPPGRVFVDEGLAILQAKNLSRGHGWALHWSFLSLDPSGGGFPFPKHATNLVLYGKHPLYPLLLAGLDRLGGIWAMAALSLVGTIAAAIAAALLARRVEPGLSHCVFWLVGIGSPLFYDGFVVFAHTVAAAAATLVVLASLRLTDGRKLAWWVCLVAGVVVAVLLRTEAVLLLGAWALSLLAWGIVRRRREVAWIGASVGLLTVGARLFDQCWAAAVNHGELALGQAGSRTTSFDLVGRLGTAAQTLAGPSPDLARTVPSLLLLGATLCLAAGVLLLRWGNQRLAAVLGAVFLGLLMGAVALHHATTVPGLLLVCPPLVAGLLLLNRRWIGHGERRWMALALVLFTGAVLLTQYRGGGAVEWGARYLAVGLPLAAVLVVSLLRGAAHSYGHRVARFGVAVLVAGSLLIALMAATAIARQHHTTSDAIDTVMARAAQVEPGDGGKPVIVTSNWALARLAWPDYQRFRWVYLRPGERGAWYRRLERAGIVAVAEVTKSGWPEMRVIHLP